MHGGEHDVLESIIDHYASGREKGRLFHGWGLLERARTEEILTRLLPRPPARILDVGGGPGTYARWLAAAGYEVHLIDLLPLHVEEARLVRPGERPIASARVGDARRLDEADASADAVLLLGPLYHLTERRDRLQALREARRVVRPGGRVFAAAISRHASFLDGLFRRLLDDPGFVQIVERDLRDGQHRNPTNRPDYFTTAFFHQPEDLEAEAAEAFLEIEETAAIEGPGWLLPDLDARLGEPESRERLLAAIRRIEHDRALLSVSAHFMVVARRP
jgi:SAM-dependent methyltransferase